MLGNRLVCNMIQMTAGGEGAPGNILACPGRRKAGETRQLKKARGTVPRLSPPSSEKVTAPAKKIYEQKIVDNFFYQQSAVDNFLASKTLVNQMARPGPALLGRAIFSTFFAGPIFCNCLAGSALQKIFIRVGTEKKSSAIFFLKDLLKAWLAIY